MSFLVKNIRMQHRAGSLKTLRTGWLKQATAATVMKRSMWQVAGGSPDGLGGL